jgi:mannosyl-3-phosphoglycerate phosphatase
MTPVSVPPLLLFTDLDGTLLDHHTYSWEPARQALAAAQEKRLPVVFNTSKTFAECHHLQQQMGLVAPFIFENGGGIAVPEHDASIAGESDEELSGFRIKFMGTPYAQVRAALEELRQSGFDFLGFGDMTLDEVAELTGLSAPAAERAAQRDFAEPLIWRDSEERLAEFGRILRERGLSHSQGGRFLHVMGAADKGKAMRWLLDAYGMPRPRAVALGDSDNDLPMLRAADVAVLVRSPVRDVPELPLDQRPPVCMTTEETGPAGWNRAVLEIIRS